MKQLAFNPGPDPGGVTVAYRAMSRSTRLLCQASFLILDSESEIKEKRGGRDLGQFVVFVLAPCCWDDNFELELVSLMTI